MPTEDLDDMTVQVRDAVESILAVPNQTDRLWGVLFDFGVGSRAEDELLALRQASRPATTAQWVSAAQHVLERLWARQGRLGCDRYLVTLAALAEGVAATDTPPSTTNETETE